jgi:hypothetical protein
LPPARPITRPPNRPAINPPQVISRPLPPSDRRSHETDAIEVYAPPPPSVELPPPVGDRSAGQYSQHKRISDRIPDVLKETRRTPAPGVPIPAGLGRPPVRPTPPSPIPRPPNLAQAPIPQPPPRPVEPARTRTPTPVRIAAQTPPMASRTVSSSSNSAGVVMTRPAVIVGAPAKPVGGTTQRVRKAREDEGRGFGQGLISEKSLDEVILAYLSEDADDK